MSSRAEIDDIHSDESRQDALAPGDALLGGQYHIKRFLAAGGFGVTYLAIDSLDRTVVIKECYPEIFCCRSGASVRVRSAAMAEDFETVVRHFKREALRLAKLSHPNIVGVHQVFEDNGTAYMALDYVDGQDLMSLIEGGRARLTPGEVKEMLIKLLEAVGYLHENNILHRDISPDNILVDRTGNPVLIDFGAAHEVAASSNRALSVLQVVKDGYSPQEAYLSGIEQTAPSDLYAIAATFYHLITGAAPPDSQARLAALASDRPDPCAPIPPVGSGYDQFFLGAIDSALAVLPEDRPQSAAEWIAMIEEKRRREALMAKAQRDTAIELDIKFLTAETNRAILGSHRATAVPKPRRVSLPRRPEPASRTKTPADTPPPAPPPAEPEVSPDLSGLKPAARRSILGRILSAPGTLLGPKSPAGAEPDRRGA